LTMYEEKNTQEKKKSTRRGVGGVFFCRNTGFGHRSVLVATKRQDAAISKETGKPSRENCQTTHWTTAPQTPGSGGLGGRPEGQNWGVTWADRNAPAKEEKKKKTEKSVQYRRAGGEKKGCEN